LTGYELDRRDGIKAVGNDHWIHIRKSGTEPIIRIYVESPSEEQSRDICSSLIKRILAI